MIRSLRSFVVLAAITLLSATVTCLQAETTPASTENSGNSLPSGWSMMAQRDEIRPAFLFDPKGGPNGLGAFVISTSDSVGENGWFQKSFPVTGGKFVQFQAFRHVERVTSPYRSAVVRILWQDAQGKPVPGNVPSHRDSQPGNVPIAAPEHPLDAETRTDSWTRVAAVYHVPPKATQAIVELHLQWAPNAKCRWSEVTFTETAEKPSRKIRLASIHYVPSGKSVQANCDEFAPLIAEASKQRADLVVLGETITYVGLKKTPDQIAETVPGPSTEYFGKLAKQHGLHIVVGLYERDGRIVYNVACLVGPDGTLLGKYRKVCLPYNEIADGVTPGNDYPVFDTKIGKIGMMVCYDGFFPEVARELTNRGAEVIAWPVWGCNPLLARARACENHVYVVSSTYNASSNNWSISAVYDHAGEPIAKADKYGDIAIAEVDLNERHFWRNNLGDFHSMVQRHRPPAISASTAASGSIDSGDLKSSKQSVEKLP